MSFLYPLGLLGLIGIPILILIYIIKSKYTEQTVASTYLWMLSERFLKRKRRVSPLAGIISLVLQILAVTIISLAIAHPIITVPNAAREYCFILDGSGSMNTLVSDEGEVTRFEAAKAAIADRMDHAMDGSIFTLLYVGNTTSVVFEQVGDKEQARVLLDELEPVYNTAELADAIGLAQGYFNENPATLTYLVTDTDYKTTQNLEVINVADSVENYAISDVTYTHVGQQLTISGRLISYVSDSTLTVGLYLNGEDEPLATEFLEVRAGNPTPFEFETTLDTFSVMTLKIVEADALPLDNEYRIHNVQSDEAYRTLIVSERPFFFSSVLRSLVDSEITVLAPDEYTGQNGYGLYVFDSVDPAKLTDLPADGTVWLINIGGSVKGAGYTVQGIVALQEADILEYTSSTSSQAEVLMDGLIKNDIHFTQYIKCGFYRNFTTLLSYKGNPVAFVGTSEMGNREVVLAFDVHRTDFPLLYDFTTLMRNLVHYSFPDMIDGTAFECGEEASINVLANCESIRVEAPSGGVTYLNTRVATDAIQLTEVGEYTVTMTIAGTPREFRIWSSLVESERAPVQVAESLRLQGEAQDGGFEGKFDPLWILFIALAVVFLADWMVYCYEKYQLR